MAESQGATPGNSERPEGSLREVSFAVLLKDLAARDFTGVLEIRRRQLVKEIVFELGVPVDCRSNLVHETLGRFLVSRGRLSDEQHDVCLRESIRREVRLGEVLRERGIVDSEELFRLLQQNLAKKLLDGFTWTEGTYRLLGDPPRTRSPLKVRVPQLVLTGVTKFTSQTEVNAGVWPLVGRRLGLHPAPAFRLGRLKLSADQRRVVEQLVEPREIRAVAESAEVPFDEVTRLVYALAILGAVAVAEELEPIAGSLPEWAREAESRATVAGPAAAGPAAPLSAEEAKGRRQGVMDAYLSHRHQDAFDLLGVPDDVGAPAVREAYLAFALRFAPWRYRDPELAAVSEEAQDLFLAGARAYAELMDTEQRNTLLYRRKLLAERAAKTSPGFRIETDLLDSEKQYRKGRALFDEGKLREALELLEFAADCDPQNALYRAETAYCRYLLNPGTGAAGALEELTEALRIDPGCGLAALYAGEVSRAQGDFERAEGLLRRANQLMAPDRRPIEALKALARDQKKHR